MSKSWESGSSRHWRALRERILLRDQYLCQVKLAGVCVEHADQVHHTMGKAQTGSDPRYLQAACSPCNARVGDPAASTAHAKVVAWIRARGRPVTARAIAAEFSDINPSTRAWILKRAVQRGELELAAPKTYRAGATDLPEKNVPQFKPVTKW